VSGADPLTYGQLPVGVDPTAWYGRQYNPNISLAVWNVQDQLKHRVTSVFGNIGLPIQAYVYPDFDRDTWWSGPEIGFVLLVYRGTRLSKPLSTDAMVQERTLEFNVVVLARTISWALRGSQSVYALVDAVENALTGFRPHGCRNAYFTDERFTERDSEGGVWLYELKLEVITMRPKMDENYILGQLQDVINQVYMAATPGQPQMINNSRQLAVPANTVVTKIVTALGLTAVLGVDYQFSVHTGIIAMQPTSTLLVPGTEVTVFSAPVIETN
jgi:hypothetical protein